MNKQILFPAIVMLIDAVTLNETVIDLKKNFENMLKRLLPDMDVAQFIVNLALDSNISGQQHEIQAIWVYDDSTRKLSHCVPSALESELNGVAFKDDLGEFSLASLSPDGMTSREDLFLNLLSIVGESEEVKQLIIVPPEGGFLEQTTAELSEIKGKEITLFCMNEPEKEIGFVRQVLAYPIMQALGIRGDELD